ncbi:MAG: DUF5724 domain-containing protein, partial [Moraxella sp.]|nr:DUF5724 domain-containing protein [Moraxella sp.]
LSSSTSVSPHPYGLSKLLSAMRLDLKALQALIVQHKDHEYTREYSDGQKETVLLGNSLHASKNFTPSTHDEAGKPLPQAVIDRENRTLFEHYPLWQVWDKWYQDAGWTPLDLFLFNHIQETNGDYDKPYLPAVKDFVFVAGNYIPKMGQYNWNNPIITVLHALTLAYPYHDKNSYLIGATQAMFASFGDDILQMTVKYARNSYTYNFHGENGNGWQAVSVYNRHLKALDLDKLSDDETGAVLALYRFWQYAGKTENIKHAIPPLQLYIKAYGFGLIDDNEMTCDLLLTDKALQDLTDTNRHAIYYNRWIKHALADNPKLVNLLTHIINYCLDIELTRGEIDTPVSRFVAQFGRIEGIDRLVALIDGLGKTKLYASYIYEWNGVDKRQLFSLLINNCHPRSDESQADFDKAIKHACATNPAIFSEQKLIEIAIYAQQWQTMISAYLGWQGLDSGIWWLKAHTKTTSYQEISSEDESEIAKLSSLEIDEFKIGAVDKEWFEQAYKMLGKARWEMLYDSAKYVSDGNGHRRAKIYSDVLTGDLKIREVTAKVKDKRDQEYLRVYGLVPLSRTQADTDVLNRYLYLQQFLKESRQFGSQRQASEATAVQVAMDNLARNAGYADPQRLGWAMESKALQRILAGDTEYHADNVSIRLMIDDDGVAQVVCEKDGKPLKAVPAKYKKAPEVVALTAHKKTLTEQARRAKKGLEEAMIRGDVFTQAELQELLAHPVIGRLLDKLLFISVEPSPSVAPSFDFGHALVSTQDSTGNIADNATGDITDKQFRLAHCTDLHTHKVWREYQQHCFDKQLRQPFKQIFRELYLPTADELQAVTVSSRYAGHQVNPKQTAALLKSRGWRVDYETGLQKVYHKQGFFVKLYAVADWFSPADVESPTLETMEFHHLKTHEAVPFDKIEPRIFSEIMRDVDLVVSVAHVGGVDPETSQSSIEMRAVIMTETARLFKLNNVIIKGSHARITGTLGNYSLHLGSGTIHQDGRYLSVIAVQSQHRGRVFLPFIDDDPKTAEIISKMLLLARDNEIKDPTILRQMG